VILLRLITWPYVRKHLLRSILTTAGIVLGVALLVGMRTADQSVLRSLTSTVDRIAGKAQLEVYSGDTGFPEEVLERVESVPEVRAAAPVIEAAVDTGLPGQGKLLILAVDMTGDRSLRDYDFENGDENVIDDPLVFLAQPDSLIITLDFAQRNGLATGARIALDTMEGRKQFTIRGILKAGGMAAAFGGNLGIMDIYAAEKVFGRGRRFDRIDIGLRDGVSLEQGEASLRRALGAGLTVEPPATRGRQFEALLGIYSLAVNVSSLFAIFVGMFIIYNSFSIAVTQRRGEIGILRALGATRGQIRTLFLAESAVAGIFGSALGVAVGLAFARSLTSATGQMLEAMFGVTGNPQGVTLDSGFLILAFLLGVLTSMLAAFVPARNAARVEPVQALQKGKYQVLSAGESRARRVAALAAAVGALLCLALSQYRPLFYLGYILILLAGLLLTPFLSLELAKLLRVPLKWLRPVEGSLAADSLIQSPRRTSATVAALMLSLGLVIGTGGVARASLESIQEWVNNTLNPDLFVSTSQNIATRSFTLPPSLRGGIEEIPGVDEVQPVRMARLQFRGQPIMLVALELARVGRRIHPLAAAGDPAVMYRLASEEKGLILAENLAELLHIRLGEVLELDAPAGTLHLPVVGIIRDYSNQLGTMFLERKTYVRYYQDENVDLFRVYLKHGASVNDVRRQIVDRLGSGRRLFVLLNQEVRDYAINVTNQWFGMTYLQVFVAVLVAILGIINTLTVSISDRRRELGVLRAVGGLRAQIRRTVWMEAAAIGLIGLLLGMALGAVNLYYELQMIQHDLAGFPLQYEFPIGMAAVLFPLILVAAVVAAIWPAETAVRSPLVEALEYE
jgi:putative ABC transport system permease protein